MVEWAVRGPTPGPPPPGFAPKAHLRSPRQFLSGIPLVSSCDDEGILVAFCLARPKAFSSTVPSRVFLLIFSLSSHINPTSRLGRRPSPRRASRIAEAAGQEDKCRLVHLLRLTGPTLCHRPIRSLMLKFGPQTKHACARARDSQSSMLLLLPSEKDTTTSTTDRLSLEPSNCSKFSISFPFPTSLPSSFSLLQQLY